MPFSSKPQCPEPQSLGLDQEAYVFVPDNRGSVCKLFTESDVKCFSLRALDENKSSNAPVPVK